MSDDTLTARANREFCYRWTCRCGYENRQMECEPGKSYECGGCCRTVLIDSIRFDNGALMHAAEQETTDASYCQKLKEPNEDSD